MGKFCEIMCITQIEKKEDFEDADVNFDGSNNQYIWETSGYNFTLNVKLGFVTQWKTC